MKNIIKDAKEEPQSQNIGHQWHQEEEKQTMIDSIQATKQRKVEQKAPSFLYKMRLQC